MILFLSDFPQSREQFKDGFFQRVVDIDSYFEEEERVYLVVSLKKNFKLKKIKAGKRTIIYCNPILHFFKILDFFQKADFIYIQSMHNVIYNFLFIKFINKKYVIDLHGVVPEELYFQGYKLMSFIYNQIEQFIFNKLFVAVGVTNKLADHYRNKYPNSDTKYIVYPILPKFLSDENVVHESIGNIKIIYSGNTQKWQNIDLMFQLIRDNKHLGFEYIILTGEEEKMRTFAIKYNLKEDDFLKITSVAPEELENYYKQAAYGFVLRDDILVNNVACPTKIIEYMHYGITPIVLSSNIGDFKNYDYEWVSYKEFGKDLINRKSLKNISIVKMLKENKRKGIQELFEILNYNRK